jgi:hypothetical protein
VTTPRPKAPASTTPAPTSTTPAPTQHPVTPAPAPANGAGELGATVKAPALTDTIAPSGDLPAQGNGVSRLWILKHPAFPLPVQVQLSPSSTAEDAAQCLVAHTGLRSNDPILAIDGGLIDKSGNAIIAPV